MMDTVLITGGSGLVGRALTDFLLGRGYRVIVYTRKMRPSPHPNLRFALWDPSRQTLDAAALQEADQIVHLAGANVADKRWTESRKQEILDSRVQSAQLLYDQLSRIPNKVRTFVSASATGYYGEFQGKNFLETDPPANDYLGKTCVAWENAVQQMSTLGKKVIILRTGIVLSNHGGALKEFIKPVRLGFATVMGSGQQFISWIHLQDLVRLYHNALTNDQLTGIYNAVSPFPITNQELVTQLARAVKGKSFVTVHVPAFALKLAMGEMSVEVLKSVKASSAKIQSTGFQFSYPRIPDALAQLVTSGD
ncbi:TIGR01777 family oxidoreductase [Chitinophaga sp. NPDC101104]|uniref:TIGR01777 family oxidoreductase n=1 Tax=Chitinophaga sp. NPDC101104 TaxID=3390561 RepID=UPI003CFC52CD